MLVALRSFPRRVAGLFAAFLLVAGVARAAEPPSLAVLPLEKGAGSAQYDGLGRALAGMLVTDLSALPTLRLVERDQLEALLAEMKLKDSGFLDPKTAQRLGKGLGARYVVVGSFTVIEPKFLLDARIVEVASGEIVKSQNAAGTVEDFVSVEKDLVEKLVTNLDLTLSSSERRKLLASVPTEKFSAFKSYGEGLARQSEGKNDEAKAAFGRALTEDPAFADARRALDELVAMVAEVKTERKQAAAKVTDAAHKQLLADVPDERTRAAGYADTEAELIAWDVRINVLAIDHQDCDLYAEMDHFLTRKNWKIAEKAEPQIAVGMKLYEVVRPRNFTSADMDKFRPYLIERYGDYLGVMVRAANACFTPAKGVKIADDVRKAVTARGLEGHQSVVTGALGPHMEVLWAELTAGRIGATDELTRRTKALLMADTSSEMEGTVGRILKATQATQRRHGVDLAEVARRVQLVAEGSVVRSATCEATQGQASAAKEWLGDYDFGRWGYTGMVAEDLSDSSIPIWGPASDFGCLEGAAPRFPNADAAVEFFGKAHSRTDSAGDDDDCREVWRDFDHDFATAKASKDLPALFTVGQDWAVLLSKRCAHE